MACSRQVWLAGWLAVTIRAGVEKESRARTQNSTAQHRTAQHRIETQLSTVTAQLKQYTASWHDIIYAKYYNVNWSAEQSQGRAEHCRAAQHRVASGGQK
jgi:hypothetical protein